MDQRRVILLVEQFLRESGFDRTFHLLQEESGVSWDSALPDFPRTGGQLMEKLVSQYELELMMGDQSSGGHSDDAAAYLRGLIVPLKPSERRIGCSVDPSAPSSSVPNPDALPVVSPTSIVTRLHVSGIIAVKFSRCGRVVASGGVDRSLVLSRADNGAVLHTFPLLHSAAILSLAWNPVPSQSHLLLSSSVDGSVALFDPRPAFLALPAALPSDAPPIAAVRPTKLHSKYVVRARWHPDGVHFATASYDQTALLCRVDADQQIHVVQQYHFAANVEAVDFSPDGKMLLMVPRSDNYVTMAEVASPPTLTKHNLNANQDDHVSFSVLDLRFSPDGRGLLLQTDAQRIMLLHFPSFTHLKSFYGAQNDQYSQPAVEWDPSGRFIYATSLDRAVYVWEVPTQQLILRLTGHTKAVSSFDILKQRGQDGGTLVSCGYVQTLCYYRF